MSTTAQMPLPEKITINGDIEVTFRTIAMSFGDGYEQTAPDGLNDVVETRTIEWAPLDNAEMQTVWNTLLTVKATGILLWTPCGESVEKKYQLADSKISRTRLGSSSHKITIKVKQSFALN